MCSEPTTASHCIITTGTGVCLAPGVSTNSGNPSKMLYATMFLTFVMYISAVVLGDQIISNTAVVIPDGINV
ncbi:hypothetical protein BABINDRAFT_159809 [Babjeviella inositovora NRRL Y-12698]|uniref:Uncharacterized protein n=1 Tax=Babjeviella inositovora NRRL Y-12698 TaxID=984486 RepID=A0A1E3QV35_9ASCO|nr:uncharacterized protein BABINDRAFT_159809 [Babjeviella inositovora NRRL Y-12698]ODQ81531.1 hypothetical protein BABINDRAFT_159809 [Babjeviella inositovora NRRL Y-12698]